MSKTINLPELDSYYKRLSEEIECMPVHEYKTMRNEWEQSSDNRDYISGY